jgi:ectoine hydroxylase-related dioxygenase (phytanoyl-CoA dioxygenase family)
MIDVEQFESEGFAMTPSLLSSDEIERLIAVIEKHASPEPKRGGVRDIMDRALELRAVADNIKVREVVELILGPNAFVVRSTLFDKTGAANWKVPWHQDVTIAVQKRHDVEGYGPWSNKEGVMHVQPPSQVLERMVTVRIHLDDCPASNGALRVMPGTHRLGKLNQNAVAPYIDETSAFCCRAKAGEALVMRPLLLHASSAAEHPGHRRVLHFDFAIGELESGLKWRMRDRGDTGANAHT